MPKDVPKIIWQTHNYLYEELPKHLKQVTQTWINLNPTWEYRYVNHRDRAEFVKTEDPVLYTHFEKLAPITQADIWRYCVMYEKGGVYLDAKFYGIDGFKFIYLTDKEHFCSDFNEKLGAVSNGLFICKPKNPIFLKAIHQLLQELTP